MTETLATKKAFSELAGVSPAAITLACKESGPLRHAVDGKKIDIAHPDARAYLLKHAGHAPDSVPAGMNRKQGRPWDGVPRVEKPAPKPKRQPAPKPEKQPKPPKQKPEPQAKAGSYDRPTGHRARNQREKQADHERRSSGTDTGAEDVPEHIAEFADMTLRELVQRFGTELRFKDWLAALKGIEDIREKRIKNAEREGELIPRELVRQHIVGRFEQAHISMLTDGAQTIAAKVVAMVHAGADQAECQRFVSDTLSKIIRGAKGSIDRTLRNA